MTSSPHLHVTSHVVRFGSRIYQISNICSVSAHRYRVTLLDVIVIVLPALAGLMAGQVVEAASSVPFLLFSAAYLAYIFFRVSRKSLHVEMSSGSADLFYTNNYDFLMEIVGAIESSMVSSTGNTVYTYNIHDESVVCSNNIGSISNVGEIGTIGDVNTLAPNGGQ